MERLSKVRERSPIRNGQVKEEPRPGKLLKIKKKLYRFIFIFSERRKRSSHAGKKPSTGAIPSPALVPSKAPGDAPAAAGAPLRSAMASAPLRRFLPTVIHSIKKIN